MGNDYKYNWDEMIRRLFHINEHRINITVWMMKWWWNGGVEQKAKLLGECWTFFNLHFPTPAVEENLRLQNWEKSANIWLVLAIQTVMPVGYTILLLSAKTKQGNQRNEASRLRKCIKKSSALSLAWNAKKSLCKLNSLHCRQKTPTSLWKLEQKGNWKKRNCGHRLIMHSITRRDDMWGGGGRVKWEDSGGGGGGGGSFMPN